MPCCIHCRGTTPLPRYTEPDFKVVEKNHVVYHQWLYYSCPKCKKEASMELTYEVVTENGSAVQEVRKALKSKNPKWVVPDLLPTSSGRVTHLPGQGEGASLPVPKVQRQIGNSRKLHGVSAK